MKKVNYRHASPFKLLLQVPKTVKRILRATYSIPLGLFVMWTGFKPLLSRSILPFREYRPQDRAQTKDKRRLAQLPVNVDFRVLILVSTKDRSSVSYSCISTLLPIPNLSKIIVIDDCSTDMNDGVDRLGVQRITTSRTIGANGTGLCRFALALSQLYQYEYFYFADNDIYHAHTFWQDLHRLIRQKEPGAISPAFWPNELHQVTISDGWRKDLSISGASIVLHRSHLFGAFVTILLNYQWGNHGWDWNLSHYVCTNCDIISPTYSLVQHLGYSNGLHPEILTINYKPCTYYFSPQCNPVDLKGKIKLCLLLGLSVDDAKVCTYWINTFDQAITPDPILAAKLMEFGCDNVYLESCDTRAWMSNVIPYCDCLAVLATNEMQTTFSDNYRDLVSIYSRQQHATEELMVNPNLSISFWPL